MKEEQILNELRKDGRATLSKISKQLGIPVSSVWEKLKSDIAPVTRFAALPDWGKLGYASRATIILKVDKEQKQKVAEFLLGHEAVNSLYRINNGYDFLLDVIFKQMADLEEFIEQLERKFRIKHKEVYFIIGALAQEKRLVEET